MKWDYTDSNSSTKLSLWTVEILVLQQMVRRLIATILSLIACVMSVTVGSDLVATILSLIACVMSVTVGSD
jgi:hypothetical protein